jgi:hypothetical protein
MAGGAPSSGGSTPAGGAGGRGGATGGATAGAGGGGRGGISSSGGAAGGSSSPPGGQMGTFAVPTPGLPDLTLNGCGASYMVGASNNHGIAFTMGTDDLQPSAPLTTAPIFRAAWAGGYVGDGGYTSTRTTPVTSADLFGAFHTYFPIIKPGSLLDFMVGAGGVIWDDFHQQIVASQTLEDLHAIDGVLGGDAWAVGANGAMIKWTGTQWQLGTRPPEPGLTLRGVSVATPTDVMAVGDGGRALYWDGAVWTSLPTGTTARLNAVAHGTVQTGILTTFYAVGDAGTVLKWDGVSWSSLTSPTTAPLYAACAQSIGLTVGGQGGAYVLPFNGAQWKPYPLNLGVPSATPAIAALSATNVWAAFSSKGTSQIVHYDGIQWTNVSFLQYPTISRIVASPQGTLWFNGVSGGATLTGGSLHPGGLPVAGPAAAGSDTDLWMVTDSGGILIHSNGTTAGSGGPPGVSVVDVTATSPTDVWAIGLSELWLWNGTTWIARPLPAAAGSAGAFQRVRRTGSNTVWILAANALLRWNGTGTPLTQWSLPGALTSNTAPAAAIRLLPLSDTNVWVSGPGGAYQLDGTNWTQRSSEKILDLSGDATRVWGVTASSILSFAP